MIHFIINNERLSCDCADSLILLDYLREQHDLTATKGACLQGECGSCLVLLGKMQEDKLTYQAVPSCLLAMGDLQGKHIVTVEGLNQPGLNPIQQALIDAGAVQCGFCTPGFIIAITEFLLNSPEQSLDAAKQALSGNLCRCTGYQSIKNALATLINSVKSRRFPDLMTQGIIPDYFAEIPRRLAGLPVATESTNSATAIGGGTDYLIQHPDQQIALAFLNKPHELNKIRLEKGLCYLSAETTVEDLRTAAIMQDIFPAIEEYLKGFASRPIRQRATLAGNLANASPIADISILLLALNAGLELQNSHQTRTIALKDFFLSYKRTALQAEELITGIKIQLPIAKFNFEKVAKRQCQDIASVNTAMQVQSSDGSIQQIHLAAGGVAPTPMYLEQTVNFLTGKRVSAGMLRQALKIAQSEIQPISDIRGRSTYKRLLFQQLFIAHFLSLFPDTVLWEDLQVDGLVQ